VFCTSLVCPVTLRAALSWRELWTLAARCTLPVFLSTAVTVYLACRLMESDGSGRSAWDIALGLACQASWFPALLLFFRQNSPWAAVLAVVLATAGTRALLLAAEGDAEGEMRRPRAMGAAVALELGAAGMCMGNWQWAALLLLPAAALLTWMLSSGNLWPLDRFRRGRRIRLVPVFLAGTMFSAGGLTPYLRHGEGSGGIADFLRALFSDGGSAEQSTDTGETIAFQGSADRWRFTERGDAPVEIDEAYPGVILWPDLEPYTILLPPLPTPRSALLSQPETATAGIPFSGFYSFQRAMARAPKQWHQTHGDPAVQTFRTTDRSHLVMEAHQDLGRPVDIACCREIRLALRVADARPETVRVAVVLSDRAAEGRPTERLPMARLAETMVFRMPESPALRQFDHVSVEFHLGGPRSDRSARIAIRRFHFVP
jgi:hypothetical protein